MGELNPVELSRRLHVLQLRMGSAVCTCVRGLVSVFIVGSTGERVRTGNGDDRAVGRDGQSRGILQLSLEVSDGELQTPVLPSQRVYQRFEILRLGHTG